MKNYKNKLVGIITLIFTLALIPQLTFAKTDTVKKIENISISVQQGAKYNLPSTVKAQMSNNKTQNLAVKWNPVTVNTNTAGTFKYNGTVKGYSKKVVLSLKVLAVSKPAATETKTPAVETKTPAAENSKTTPTPASTPTPAAKVTPAPKATPAPADGTSGATEDTTTTK
jgi:hypothetical protein